jgi:hypothetical protein
VNNQISIDDFTRIINLLNGVDESFTVHILPLFPERLPYLAL